MSDKLEKHLENIDEERRAAIKKMVLGAAFVIPAVSTFSINGKALAAPVACNTVCS